MVALRRIPRDLPPPLPDGRPCREVHSYSYDKAHYWGGMVNAASRAMRGPFSGRRACIDLFASYGFNRDKANGELSWGSALLALHADDGFDVYIFCDRDPRATAVLAERIADPHIFGLDPLSVDLGSEALGAQIQKAIDTQTDRAKVIVITGDANHAPAVVKMLLPAWEQRRYALAMIDPPGADFTWEALGQLTLNERMDLVLLFPEDMDIERNLPLYAAMEPPCKLDHYLGLDFDWRAVVSDASVTRPGIALRDHYKRRMNTQLGYVEIAGIDKIVRNSKNSELYKLIFASKHRKGREIWESVNKDEPSGQICLPFDY